MKIDYSHNYIWLTYDVSFLENDSAKRTRFCQLYSLKELHNVTFLLLSKKLKYRTEFGPAETELIVLVLFNNKPYYCPIIFDLTFYCDVTDLYSLEKQRSVCLLLLKQNDFNLRTHLRTRKTTVRGLEGPFGCSTNGCINGSERFTDLMWREPLSL